MKVLVLDGDAARRARSREALARGGFLVEEAAGWAEARARLDAGGIGVCVVAGERGDEDHGGDEPGRAPPSREANVRFVQVGPRSEAARSASSGSGMGGGTDWMVGPWGGARLCAFVRRAGQKQRLDEERRRRLESLRLLGDDLAREIERREGALVQVTRAQIAARLSASGLAGDIAGPVDRVRLHIARVLQPPVDVDEGCRAALEDAFGAAERVLRMAQDVRDVGLAEAGELVASRRPVEVGDLLTTIVSTVEKLARDYRARIELSVPEGLGSITADPELIHRAVLNLVERAVRQSRRGVVRVGASREDGAVRMWVCDSGPPLCPEDAGQILEKRARLDAANGALHRGLGLPFADAAVRAHGGRITVEPEPGAGTRFVITLAEGVQESARKVA